MYASATASTSRGRRYLCSDVTRCGAAAVAAILLACCTSPNPPPESINGNDPPAHEVEPSPPEGAILLSMGARLFPTGAPTDATPGFVGEAISPDGATVVATTEVRLPTGISYNSDLVLIDARTREESVLARTGPREEFNGPIEWSPDGTKIAYNFVRYRTNPAVVPSRSSSSTADRLHHRAPGTNAEVLSGLGNRVRLRLVTGRAIACGNRSATPVPSTGGRRDRKTVQAHDA